MSKIRTDLWYKMNYTNSLATSLSRTIRYSLTLFSVHLIFFSVSVHCLPFASLYFINFWNRFLLLFCFFFYSRLGQHRHSPPISIEMHINFAISYVRYEIGFAHFKRSKWNVLCFHSIFWPCGPINLCIPFQIDCHAVLFYPPNHIRSFFSHLLCLCRFPTCTFQRARKKFAIKSNSSFGVCMMGNNDFFLLFVVFLLVLSATFVFNFESVFPFRLSQFPFRSKAVLQLFIGQEIRKSHIYILY